MTTSSGLGIALALCGEHLEICSPVCSPRGGAGEPSRTRPSCSLNTRLGVPRAPPSAHRRPRRMRSRSSIVSATTTVPKARAFWSTLRGSSTRRASS